MAHELELMMAISKYLALSLAIHSELKTDDILVLLHSQISLVNPSYK